MSIYVGKREGPTPPDFWGPKFKFTFPILTYFGVASRELKMLRDLVKPKFREKRSKGDVLCAMTAKPRS